MTFYAKFAVGCTDRVTIDSILYCRIANAAIRTVLITLHV